MDFGLRKWGDVRTVTISLLAKILYVCACMKHIDLFNLRLKNMPQFYNHV